MFDRQTFYLEVIFALFPLLRSSVAVAITIVIIKKTLIISSQGIDNAQGARCSNDVI